MNIAEVIGKNLLRLRKGKNLTQDEVAERLGVSPQAVSKWENGISCPDIALLPDIAKIYGVMIDELMNETNENDEKRPVMLLVPEEKRKKPEEIILRILVDGGDGDKVRVNLPLPLLKAGMNLGIASKFTDKYSLKDIDLEEVFRLAESGVMGTLVEVEGADGSCVKIVVE